ncbi:hypothetical protein BGZ63DRAFT_353811 [Mariannaea sp. PMI_226]|nr:hypothetical protein BGZ63DRAFT_353811 [Mariannaea sp. PMI_226]
MNALEKEVLRLREEKETLHQLAANWERLTLALIGPAERSHRTNRPEVQFSPGLFAWTVVDVSSDALQSSMHFQWQLPQLHQSINPSIPNLSQSGLHGTMAPALFQNFYDNIIPSLNIAESTNDGYVNSLLAGSASHIQLARGKNMAIHHLEYRSTAFEELRQASSRSQLDFTISLPALSAILGLLIDDMITYSRDFPTLLNLAIFWIRKDCLCSHEPEEEAMRRFLLDQIQMMKTLVHPLYQFDMQSLSLIGSSQKANNQLSVILNPVNLHEIFLALETAMAQACQLYRLIPTTNLPGNNHISTAQLTEAGRLLDKLQSTVHNVPPFSLGENSLVWVYYVAATRSAQIHHRTFFASRLAELLHRIGHDNVNDILAKSNIV